MKINRPLIHKVNWVIITALLVILLNIYQNNVLNKKPFRWTQEATQSDWTVSSPEREGFNPSELIKLHKNVERNSAKKVQSMLIARNGKLVFERYYLNRSSSDGTPMPDPYPPAPDTFHHMKSVTKTVTATLIGSLLYQKAIPSIDTPLFDYYLEDDVPNLDSKRNILIKHALDFNSGLDWSEWNERNSDAMNMWLSDDPYRYIFEKDVLHTPGEKYVYQGAMSVLLGGLVERVTGKELRTYTSEALFAPLNIVNYHWFPHEVTGDFLGSSGLYLRSRDFAKLGQLYLNKGLWNGQRVFSEQWAEECLVPKGQFWKDRTIQYGHNWWFPLIKVGDEKMLIAAMRGAGGQDMFIIPELQLIFLITSGNYQQQDEHYPLDLIANYVLPSLNITHAKHYPFSR
jgi:CubicO group peptidase (beta-lactamase class C family)